MFIFICCLCLFFIGFIGTLLIYRHFINILISIELLLLSINLNFVIFSYLLDDYIGQIYSLMVLTFAAVDTSIGLSIIVIYYRLRGGISIDFISTIKA
jgi:NADH:ubiquinone oxidoreductase subunit K